MRELSTISAVGGVELLKVFYDGKNVHGPPSKPQNTFAHTQTHKNFCTAPPLLHMYAVVCIFVVE